MVLPIIIQKVVERAVPYVSNILRSQGRIVDYTYTRPFLTRNINPYIRRGIKRGLAGGQVVAGLQELNSVGNFVVPDAPFSSPSIKTGKFRQARNNMVKFKSKRQYCPEYSSGKRRRQSSRYYR